MDERAERRPGRPPAWRELLLGLVLFVVYLAVDSRDGPTRRASAHHNAQLIQHAERALHIDVEAWANALLVPHHVLTIAANYEYATTYIISAALLLGVTYWRSPPIYRVTRNSFICLNLLAFACFWFFPVRPPRMFAGSFVDTVAQDATIGSWGSPLVAHANQLAAMPSLHMAWALWVSVMLARLSHAKWLQLVSAAHVALTFVVVTVTANHYVLDTVGAAVVVAAGVLLAEAWTATPDRLATADEFFLNVEKGPNAQNVGGYVILDLQGATPPTADDLRELARDGLAGHRRFVSRLDERRGRHEWTPITEMDWSAHVTTLELPAGAGRAELDTMVAGLAAERLPRDRPLWRIAAITGLPDGNAAFVVLVHHCMADGIGSVAQLLSLVRPAIALPAPEHPTPSRTKSAAAIAAGLAQLATDGRPARVLPPGAGATDLSTVTLDFDQVRRIARSHGARVTEVLIALVASSVAGTAPQFAARLRHRLRVSVPVMLGVPGADDGNSTAAAIIETPCVDLPLADLLPRTRSGAAPLRTPTRPLASRWVMSKALRMLPARARSGFARTVYGRRFFHAIVSNIPGPDAPVTLLGARMDQVYPLLPPAPGAPLTVGALTWQGKLGLSITTDPDQLDAVALGAEIRRRCEAASAERTHPSAAH